MKSTCCYLKPSRLKGVMLCKAAVNFASVGAGRELCRKCDLANLDDLPLCPNAEVYTFLRKSAGGEVVELEFACVAKKLHPEERCQGCPDHLLESVC
jgi:hypothetical protein